LMASEARSGRRRERRCGEFTAGVGRHGGEDGADKRGPVVKETRGRRPAREGVNRREKRIYHEDAIDVRAGWAGRAISACGDGAAGGLAGPEAKRATGSAGPKNRKRNFRIKNLIFEFIKALKIRRRRFRRNFDMRIFPKFF
jgi:hypothetical protein